MSWGMAYGFPLLLYSIDDVLQTLKIRYLRPFLGSGLFTHHYSDYVRSWFGRCSDYCPSKARAKNKTKTVVGEGLMFSDWARSRFWIQLSWKVVKSYDMYSNVLGTN